MAPKKAGLDRDIASLYRGPLEGFTSARNDLVKQLKKLGGKEEAERVRVLPKPSPSAWAVNVLFDREGERMDALLAAGQRARSGQREAVSGRGAGALRESLAELRRLTDELRRRGAAILAEGGRAVSREVIERIGTDLQALALSPDAAEAASRQWLERDLDPPGFEVLAGLQLAGAPIVDLAARREERTEKEEKKGKEAKGEPKKEEKAEAERARREREEALLRRRIEVAEEKAGRARAEAESLRAEAEAAEKTASEARRHAEAAELAAGRARDKADRAAERLARAEEEVKAARKPGA